MKKVISLLLVIVTIGIIASCNLNKPKKFTKGDQEFVILNNDTLGVLYETHIVKSCERATPIGIHEEMNPHFEDTLENGTTFKSRSLYGVGDSIIYTIYTKRDSMVYTTHIK